MQDSDDFNVICDFAEENVKWRTADSSTPHASEDAPDARVTNNQIDGS